MNYLTILAESDVTKHTQYTNAVLFAVLAFAITTYSRFVVNCHEGRSTVAANLILFFWPFVNVATIIFLLVASVSLVERISMFLIFGIVFGQMVNLFRVFREARPDEPPPPRWRTDQELLREMGYDDHLDDLYP